MEQFGEEGKMMEKSERVFFFFFFLEMETRLNCISTALAPLKPFINRLAKVAMKLVLVSIINKTRARHLGFISFNAFTF